MIPDRPGWWRMAAPEQYRGVVAQLAGAVNRLQERGRRAGRRAPPGAARLSELRAAADRLASPRGWPSSLGGGAAESCGPPRARQARPRPDHRADPARRGLERAADESALEALRAAAGPALLFRRRR
ncbi:hypothetical protein HBB16_12970 [Pseudonocardia sp. MCCB 268]|nr:hypothetical protein [Pseudonocardia cytotoxica]